VSKTGPEAARYAEKIKVIQRYLAPMPISADYSIIGWDGGKLKEEELRTTREDFEVFLRSTAGAVVMEVAITRLRHGIWSWVWGHEVLGRESAEDGKADPLG